MPREFSRAERVAASIKREVAPRLSELARANGYGMLTVTGVDVSPDLKNAVIYLSCLDTEMPGNALVEALTREAGSLRRYLAGRLKLRAVPAVTLRYDDTLARGAQLTELLDSLRDSRSDPE